MRFAERIRSMPHSKLGVALKIAQERKDVISLGTGEPDFDPPREVIESAYSHMKQGNTHYSSFMGRMELREAIAEKMRKENKMEAKPDDIIVTCGSKEAIFLLFASLADRGEEIIIPDPAYFGYMYIAKLLGINTIPVHAKQENDFELLAEDVEKKITSKTKLIVINTPTNPTGAVFSKKTLEDIADLAREKNIPVLSDEAYEKLVYEGHHYSMASFSGMQDLVITTQTFSKNYAMCGFRVGYATGPSELIKHMENLKVCTTISAPTPFQLAAKEAFKCNDYVEKMRKEYDRRRQLVIKRLGEMGITCARPKGAFYAFPDFSSLGMKSEELSNFFLENAKVYMTPGSEFGAHGEGHLRMSYATAYERLSEALSRLETSIRQKASL